MAPDEAKRARLPHDPAVPVLGVSPREMKAEVLRLLCECSQELYA